MCTRLVLSTLMRILIIRPGASGRRLVDFALAYYQGAHCRVFPHCWGAVWERRIFLVGCCVVVDCVLGSMFVDCVLGSMVVDCVLGSMFVDCMLRVTIPRVLEEACMVVVGNKFLFALGYR